MNNSPKPSYACIYAHYNGRGKVNEYVFAFLRSLAAVNCQIVLVSNSPISKDDQNKIVHDVGNVTIYIRENKGYDFGAWKWALKKQLIPRDTSYLLLANDSFIGPVTDIGEMMTNMEKRNVDFWGLTESTKNGRHIETYFFVLAKHVFLSSAFSDFFDRRFDSMSKEEIFNEAEARLAVELTKNGFSSSVYVSHEMINREKGNDDLSEEPTVFFADRLLKIYRFPFVKKKLIFNNRNTAKNGGTVILDIIRKNSQYPIANIIDLITGACDVEMHFQDSVPISVVAHLYYPHTIFSFLVQLSVLKGHRTSFIANVSSSLYIDESFKTILDHCFPGITILYTPPKGRDIGGKLAALNILLRYKEGGEYTLLVHDKLSPHTPLGDKWRDELLKIIQPESISKTFKKFHNHPDIGLITAGNFIQNEYNPDNETFRSTSSRILLNLIGQFNLKLRNYNFAAGSIFWIRTDILKRFFNAHPPLKIRESLEEGNVLDFEKGTYVHAWERLFSLLPDAYGYKIAGI